MLELGRVGVLSVDQRLSVLLLHLDLREHDEPGLILRLIGLQVV